MSERTWHDRNDTPVRWHNLKGGVSHAAYNEYAPIKTACGIWQGPGTFDDANKKCKRCLKKVEEVKA